MRCTTLGRMLVPAMLLAGCSAESVNGPEVPSGAVSVRQDDLHPETTFSYTTFAVPGAVLTAAQGINARGDIVGFYDDATGRRHGFLLRDGLFTTIDYPGAASTDARGIGPGGEIVGGYRLPGEPSVNLHGYQRSADGELTRVDYPGHTNTIPQRILADGTILGCRHNQDTMGSMYGVIMGRRGNQEIPESMSMNNGGTPDGRRIAGLYTNMAGITEGYVIEDGVFTPFRVPGSTFTAAWDMNPASDIAGVYRDATGFHGFVRRGEHYATLNVPLAAATRAFGINARGNVVGSYVAGGRTRGFLATRER